MRGLQGYSVTRVLSKAGCKGHCISCDSMSHENGDGKKHKPTLPAFKLKLIIQEEQNDLSQFWCF